MTKKEFLRSFPRFHAENWRRKRIEENKRKENELEAYRHYAIRQCKQGKG